ncbi:MAG: DctP family TRAP transporter solute-binding subunit [Bacillaceae bacterium]|nr:DctP family TRAP transporter solute-binding subunit [Bacillaceae bacterium]
MMLSVFTAACGGGGNQAEQTGSSSEGQTENNASETDEPIVIKFSHVTSPDSPKGKAADLFKELVEERLGDKVKVEVYPSSQLFDDGKLVEELPKNTVQLGAPSATKLVGIDPAFQIVDLPFLFTSNEAVYKFWDGEGGEILSKKLESRGIKLLALWPNGAKHFTNSERPLTKPEDFKGLKFRTQTGKVLEAQFNALGASAVPMAFADVYVALQQGTIEGQENTFNNIDTQSYAEVQKYLTVSGHGRIDYPLITNTKFWEGLPDDVRTELEAIIKEVTAQQRQWAEELNQQSYENLKNTDLEIYELTEEDIKVFQDAMEPVYEEFSGDIGEEILELARQANE